MGRRIDMAPWARAALVALALAGSSGAGLAEETAAPAAGIAFGLPVDCDPGRTCWIAKYVDLDPGPAIRDYQCGSAANDRHTGVDLAIVDYAEMRKGVAVLAAADGTVAGLRDGVPDVEASTPDLQAAVAKVQCGNGLRIDHGNGWATLYCHMRRGSLAVAKGQTVTAGQRLGLVGSSGLAQYPHLHFSVLYRGKVIDPFVGLKRARECGPGDFPLWKPDVLARLPYGPSALYNAGFAGVEPTWDEIRQGSHHETTLPRDAPAIVLWFEAYWVQAGDRLSYTITAPGGATVVTKTDRLSKTQNRRYGYVGKPRPQGGWPKGTYKGQVSLSRADGSEEDVITRQVTVK